MLKVALYKHDRNTKTMKGGHSNNAAAGAHISIIYMSSAPVLKSSFTIGLFENTAK
jgi:hypothetical protein